MDGKYKLKSMYGVITP